MKKILSIMIAILLLTGCDTFGQKNTNQTIENNKTEENQTKEKQEDNSMINETISFSKNETELDEKDFRVSLYSKLNEYGEEIYKANKYTSFTKSNGAYFVSLNELKDLGYDISIFVGEDGTVCNKELSGIYFDTEYKIVNKENVLNNPILASLIGCSIDETNNKK